MPGHSLPVLARLLEDRTCKLREQFNRLAGQPESMNIASFATLKGLFEDLHWLILIAGHVLCMECDGEAPLVPAEVIAYSMEQVR